MVGNNNRYLVVVKLTDGTEISQPREYNWSGWDNQLSDNREDFVKIENITFNKRCIATIQIIDNPDFKNPEPKDDIVEA